MLAASSLLVALFFLWEFRPTVPPLPGSLSDSLTAHVLEGVLTFAAWVAVVALAAALLVRAVAFAAANPPRAARRIAAASETAPSTRPARPSRSRPPEPIVLTVAPRALTPASAPPKPPAEATRVPPSATSTSGSSPTYSILVLGPLAVEENGHPQRIRRAVAAELVAYLALHPDGATADDLLEALWPGQDPKQNRQRLWHGISEVRRLFGDALLRDGDRYLLDRTPIHTDLDQFERLVAEAATTDDQQRERSLLEQALTLVRGQPLAGADYLWSEGHVRRIRAAVIELLARLGRRRLEAGDARRALDAAERGLALDALNESLWRLAMEAESTLGLRGAVESRYEQLTKLLDERVGLEPDRETRLLHRRLFGQT